MKRSWRKFKKLFTSCISPAKEENVLPFLADEEQMEHRSVCKERRAFKVIQSEYMLYDSILRRRTFLEATKNEKSMVLDAAPHLDEDLSHLQRSSDSVRRPSITSLTVITSDSSHILTGWNVLEGSRLFIIDAISQPIISVSPSLELRFLQFIEDHIKVRMVELFGPGLEGTSCMLFHSNRVSRFAQPQQCLLEYTDPEGVDKSRISSGTVYDEDQRLAVYMETTESIEDESLTVVPIGAERSNEMHLSVEQCLASSIIEREKIMDELNNGAILKIGSGQGAMFLLNDIDTEEEVSSLFRQAIIRGRNSLKKVQELLVEEININQECPECSDELLMSFEERCPPGGQDSIILYTTSIHTIRKSFEDCNQIRFILSNLGIKFRERDISIDLGYREDFWNVMGFHANALGLFIKGRYIGGAKEAIELHENDKLMPLISQFVMGPEERKLLCDWCGGMGFMMCASCHGTHKIYESDWLGELDLVPCHGCNENGLVPCALCG